MAVALACQKPRDPITIMTGKVIGVARGFDPQGIVEVVNREWGRIDRQLTKEKQEAEDGQFLNSGSSGPPETSWMGFSAL